jgi:hypothetical protein
MYKRLAEDQVCERRRAHVAEGGIRHVHFSCYMQTQLVALVARRSVTRAAALWEANSAKPRTDTCHGLQPPATITRCIPGHIITAQRVHARMRTRDAMVIAQRPLTKYCLSVKGTPPSASPTI